MIDTHTHLQDKTYADNLNGVIDDYVNSGVHTVLCIGTDKQTSIEAIALAKTHQSIYATVGVHPSELQAPLNLKWMEDLVNNSSKVVAIGECGLDYHYQGYDKFLQKSAFEYQLDLSEKLQLPHIVHLRDADADCVEILIKRKLRYGGVIHCFSGNQDLAEQFLDMGYHISFSGNVTYKNAHCIQQAAMIIPLDRILVETDCPYLSPVPHRGKVNVPSFVQFTAQFLANLKSISVLELEHHTTENAKKLFKIEL
ncbi:MAG: TatD family hydrolase [Clostridiales bacterium]|jgi:TatD DNase family protein|nr:TatD family hydrolase [Clostridiales bacterium]